VGEKNDRRFKSVISQKTKIKKEVKKMEIAPSLTCLTLQFGDLIGELGKLMVKLAGLIPE
jgi:hypothetical protein